MYFGKVLCNAYEALTYLPLEVLVSLLERHRIASQSVLVISNLQKLKSHVPEIPPQCILVCPTEHFRGYPREVLKC